MQMLLPQSGPTKSILKFSMVSGTVSVSLYVRKSLEADCCILSHLGAGALDCFERR